MFSLCSHGFSLGPTVSSHTEIHACQVRCTPAVAVDQSTRVNPMRVNKVYLILTILTGVQNFDKDKTSSNILSLSPYPTAFTNQRSKNYFLTKVGPLENFNCKNISAIKDFRVGSDGNCSDPNCNGVLPTGSNVR